MDGASATYRDGEFGMQNVLEEMPWTRTDGGGLPSVGYLNYVLAWGAICQLESLGAVAD